MLGQACPDFHESLASVLEYSFCYVIVPKPEIIKFQGEKKNNEAGCFSCSLLMLWPWDRLYKWQMHPFAYNEYQPCCSCCCCFSKELRLFLELHWWTRCLVLLRSNQLLLLQHVPKALRPSGQGVPAASPQPGFKPLAWRTRAEFSGISRAGLKKTPSLCSPQGMVFTSIS